MHKRKINDHQLLEMSKSGMLQKDMAAHFGVSIAAVSKRLKHLQMPESLSVFSEKERNFALAISEGRNQTAAAAESYDCSSVASAKAIGHQLMQKDSVQIAIKDLMDQEGLGRRYRVRKLRQHVDVPDPNVSLKALDQSWRLDGGYVEKHQHLHQHQVINVNDIPEELKEVIEQAGRAYSEYLIQKSIEEQRAKEAMRKGGGGEG